MNFPPISPRETGIKAFSFPHKHQNITYYAELEKENRCLSTCLFPSPLARVVSVSLPLILLPPPTPPSLPSWRRQLCLLQAKIDHVWAMNKRSKTNLSMNHLLIPAFNKYLSTCASVFVSTFLKGNIHAC